MVGPGKLPPYVHIRVFGPFAITRTFPIRMGMVMFPPVSTSGMRNGCSKAGVAGTSPTGPPTMFRVPRIVGWKAQ